jgi:hypothetical protein
MSHRYVHNIDFPPSLSLAMHHAHTTTTTRTYPINLTLPKVELSQLANAGKGEVLPRSYVGNVECSNSFFWVMYQSKWLVGGGGLKNTVEKWPTTN